MTKMKGIRMINYRYNSPLQ